MAAWGLMPGYNVALIQLMPWTAGASRSWRTTGRTYVQGQLRSAVTTAGQGVFVEFGGRDFAGIVPEHDAVLAKILSQTRGNDRQNHDLPPEQSRAEALVQPVFRARFSFENTFSWSTGDVASTSVVKTALWCAVTAQLAMRN